MVTDPVVVKFSADTMRRLADLMESAVLTAEYVISRYDIPGGVNAKFASLTEEELADLIDDKALEEARPLYTPQYVVNYINNMKALLAQLNTADPNTGVSMRQQIAYMATNPRNPLLGG